MNNSDKQALINNSCVVPTKIIVDNGDGTSSILTEQDYILNWNYEDFRYVPDEGFIGQFVERVINVNLKNINDSFTIVNKKIEVQFGITTTDEYNVETTNWYSLGTFVVSDPKDNNVKDKTTLKAIDNTKFFEEPYDELLTYPTTAGALAYACCKQSGVELGDFSASLTTDVTIDSDKQYYIYDNANQVYQYVANPVVGDIGTYYELTFGFSNYDFLIDANPFVNNETRRVIMKAIGMLAFSWVRIDWDDKCYLDYTQETTVDSLNIITNENYYTLETTGTIFGEVNRIVVGLKDVDGENVTINDPDAVNPDEVYEIAVWDNPLTYNVDKRTETINAGTSLYGLKWQEAEIYTTGHPWLKGKEKIQIKDMEDNYIYTYPFNRTIEYTGHIKTKLTAPATSKTNTQYTYEAPITKALRNTQILVDKANSQIQTIVTETIPGMQGQLAGTVSTQDLRDFKFEVIDPLQEEVEGLSGTPEKLQNTLVTINKDGINVSTNLSKISTIMTNDTFAIKDNSDTYLAYFGYDEVEGRSKAEMNNLTITDYFIAGTHGVEKFEYNGEDRTGWFYIGGD